MFLDNFNKFLKVETFLVEENGLDIKVTIFDDRNVSVQQKKCPKAALGNFLEPKIEFLYNKTKKFVQKRSQTKKQNSFEQSFDNKKQKHIWTKEKNTKRFWTNLQDQKHFRNNFKEFSAVKTFLDKRQSQKQFWIIF